MTDERIPEDSEQPAAEQGDEAVREQSDAWEESSDSPAEEAADSDLTGSIAALEPLEPAAQSDEVPSGEGSETEPAAGDEEAEAVTTTDAPTDAQLADEEAAALAASTLPAAQYPGEQLDGESAEVDPASSEGIDLAPPEGIDMGPEDRGGWWVWVIVAVLVLAVAGAVGYAWWWSSERPISVPDVVGKQPGEATQIFNDVDLRLGEVSEVATDAAPVGSILSQDPEAGTRVKPGSRVSFTLVLPPTQTKVPDVNGRLSEDAQTELAKSSLRPFLVESFATTVAAGYVVSQLPTVGVELPPGSPVAIVVSKGPVPSAVSVPRVTGLLEADASKLLTASDLKPLVYRSFDPSITAGTVLEQSPSAGVSAPYESPVQMLVSQGPGVATIVVPPVTGQTKASATKELKGKGLKVESRNVPHPTIPKGQVVHQMPAAGRKVVSGSMVGLLVSRGNTAETNVPSLVGTSSAGVAAAISKAGFRPIVVNVPVSGFAADTVFMQFPAGGTPLTRGLPVVCLVATPVASVTASPSAGVTTTTP